MAARARTDTDGSPSGSGGYAGSGASGPSGPHRTIAVKQILATALIIVAVVLGFENTQHVNIRLVGPVVNSPVWILVAASLVLGLLAGLLLAHRSGHRK